MAVWKRIRTALSSANTAGPERARIEPTITNASDTPFVGLSEMTGEESWFTGAGGGSYGPVITDQSAMAASTVFRCVSLISGLIAGIPLGVYRDDADLGRVEVKTHRIAKFLSRTPQPGSSLAAFAWRERWGHNMLLTGNHYSVIRYDMAGRVMGFDPAQPWWVSVYKTKIPGRLVYRVEWPDRDAEIVLQDSMLHISGPGSDGMRSPSRIQAFARNAVALARTLEDGTGLAHENGAKPSGMVTLPAGVTRAQKDAIEAYVSREASGRGNRGKVLFVDKDTVFTQMQMTPEDMATLASRRFTNEEICRFFGVPPHMAGETSATTSWGTGIEQQTIGFLKFTLDADFRRVESELNLKLFPAGDFYVLFDRDALAAMDAKSAAETAALRIGSGQITINEARRKQHLPAVSDGDTVLVNSTMLPLSRVLNPPETKPNVTS